MVIEAKGGACQICGYNKCQQALHFHHLDPSEKDFTVGEYWSKVGKFNTDFFEKILKEIEKCILVCANCHAELHWLEEDNNES